MRFLAALSLVLILTCLAVPEASAQSYGTPQDLYQPAMTRGERSQPVTRTQRWAGRSRAHKRHVAVGRKKARTRPRIETAAPKALAPISSADSRDIFKAYEASLLRPAARCWDWEKIDVSVRRVISDAARHFGGVALMTSCYRSEEYNRQVYARMGRRATASQHIRRKAIDFKIAGVSPLRLALYVRGHSLMRHRGGVGRYAGNQIVHVDSGRKRNWCWGCGGGRIRMARAG